jgi:hypothetical protein
VAPEDEQSVQDPSETQGDEPKAASRRTRGRRAQRQQASEEGTEVKGGAAEPVGVGDTASGIDGQQKKTLLARTGSVLFAGGKESWDLCLVVDPVTDDESAARREVEDLFLLLRKEGLTLTDPLPLEEEIGYAGKNFALCTASQDELEQEAELMGLNKPLVLSAAAQLKFRKSAQYGRVTAPFTVARKNQFHAVPYFHMKPRGDEVLTAEEDPSGLVYFSAVERQYLLEHMIEQKIRQAVKDKKLQPKTEVTFFPLHDKDGEGSCDLLWLREHWVQALRGQRMRALLRVWSNPHAGTDEPITQVRDYFGDQIAIYFCFLSFYTKWLTYPAVVGLAFQAWTWSTSEEDNFGLVAYCVFICVWAVLMIKFWERKQNAYAYYWFTSDLATEEKVRRELYLTIEPYPKP